MMAAYLDHAVLSSPEVESRVALGLAGRISVTHKVTSRGNPRSGSPGSDDAGAQHRFPTCGRRLWRLVLVGGILRRSGVHLPRRRC
jgi:hypothetical protein